MLPYVSYYAMFFYAALRYGTLRQPFGCVAGGDVMIDVMCVIMSAVVKPEPSMGSVYSLGDTMIGY